jgi:hypothetical protein
VNDWFFMLGEPLSITEQEQVRGYLEGLGLTREIPIESVRDFDGAARIISNPEWDRRWWEAEQRERERLRVQASAALGSGPLWQQLSQSTADTIAASHGAAAIQAARIGCSDPGLIRAAAGALGEALHLAELAELAGAASSHPFLLKRALFAGGHWPLGIVTGRFYVF